jgi:isoleucyl-tRNA synthetase
LEKWPEASLEVKKSGSSEVLEGMQEVRKVVSLGLEARAKANLKVRQPLAKLTFDIHSSKIKDKPEMLALIADEVNVKAVVWGETGHDTVELDTNITAELKEEGSVRDFVRAVQELRKQKNLNPGEIKNLSVATSEAGQTFLKKYEKEITSTTATKLNFVPVLSEGIETVVDGLVFRLDI